MTDERKENYENKILPIDQYLKAREEGEDGITQLLNHMREVRDAVPVNRRLQVELKKKLLERQKELMKEASQESCTPMPVKQEHKKLRKWHPWGTPILAATAVILVIFALTGLWRYTNGQYNLEAAGTPQELTRFWTEDQPLQPAVNPEGNKVLVVRGGGLVLLSETGVQLASLDPPEGASFRSPSWSPDGKQVSFILSSQSSEEIKQLPVDELISSTKSRSLKNTAVTEEKVMAANINDEVKSSKQTALSKNIQTTHLSNLVYSPDGKKLAYVANSVGGTATVWLRNSAGEVKKITDGDAPTWSPDGKHLVVQRPSRSDGYELWLVNIETGGADLLGKGENPAWSKSGYLAFCTDKVQERILTFMPNGEPQYTVRQPVAEIRTVFLGNNGNEVLKKLKEGEGWLGLSHLLIAPENRISGMEINWLRQQEASGGSGSKTLVLNEINKCEGQVFDPAGKWLLFARRDGDTVALLKLRLEERWEKERN